MTLSEVMADLESMGNVNTKIVFLKHGAKEPFFGVKVGDLKKIVKKIKKDHELSLALYDTGNSDAMYLAGLIADESQITPQQLQHWVENAYWYMIAEYTVPWVAADSRNGLELGLKWIESEEETIASAGWATLRDLLNIDTEEVLPDDKILELLDRIQLQIHDAKNRVRYTMNAFLIAAGSHHERLTSNAISIAKSIGKVHVEMGGTACKVPDAAEYINKMVKMDRIGKKKKMARC